MRARFRDWAGTVPAQPLVRQRVGPLQRKCACGGECDECRAKADPLRRASVSPSPRSSAPTRGSNVEEVLRSPGDPLDVAIRTDMERRFGHDFGRVRVHTDARAARSALAVNARAYTVGADIVFAAGQYSPVSSEAKRLLAHELTHVVQQPEGAPLQRQPAGPPRAVPEREKELPEEPQENASRDDEVAAESTPESLEPLPEAIHIAEDLAAEEEETVASGGIAAPEIVASDDPSEREADAVSAAIVDAADDAVGLSPRSDSIPQIRSAAPGRRRLRRQIFWDVQNTLGWGDFKAGPPKKSPFSAVTSSGFKMAAPKVEARADPESQPCKVGNTPATMFRATVSLDITPANLDVRAFMQPNKSWVRANQQTPALLAHEQGHFDISHVIAEKTEFAIILWGIQNLGSATKCGKKAARNSAIKAWNALKPNKAFKKAFKKGQDVLKQAQGDYDGQTNHGVKAAEQAAWQGDITGDLPNYQVF